MKYPVFILAAVVLFAATACKEELIGPEVTPEGDDTLTSVTVKACFEADDSTKTALWYDGSVAWVAGDRIKALYDGGNATSDALAQGGNEATFSITYEAGHTLAYAVYPAGATAGYDGSSLQITVPSGQDGTFANAAVSVAKFGEGNLVFKNLGGMLKVCVDNPDVRTIRISSNDSTPIAGSATVSFDGSAPAVSGISDPSTSIELSVDGAGIFYASVLPCSLKSGLFVELLDGSDNVIGEKLSGNTLNVARRQLVNLGTVQAVTLAAKRFFKPGGSGDGTTWDNAGGVDLLKSVLEGDADATLFMAGGTYDINDITGIESLEVAKQSIWPHNNHTYKIYGGYPSDAAGTSLSGRDITANETILSGGGTKRILVLNVSKVELAVDGVTFSDAYRTGPDTGSALILQVMKKATFHNCRIIGNRKEGSGGGGAVRVAAGEAEFTDCTFQGNTSAAGGGAVGMLGGTLTMRNCVFEGNSTQGNGGAIIASDGTVNLDYCEFRFNAARASGKKGSAIYAQGTSSVRLNGCYLEKNRVAAGGTIWSTGTLFLNACSFYKDTTDTYASVIGFEGVCGVNNCAFQENINRSATGAANLYNAGGTAIIANSSIRLYANSAVGIWAAAGTTYIVNNTMVNSFTSADASKGVALKSSAPLISYGHNLVSKFYEATAATYSVENVSHADVVDYSLNQTWHNAKHCIYWTNWNEPGVSPDGFTFATRARIEDAHDGFESTAASSFRFWLQTIGVGGHNALETDILGRLRGSTSIWPGSYENTGYNLVPAQGEGPLVEMKKTGTLVRTSAADPCMVYKDGEFFLTMTGASRIALIRDTDLSNLTTSAHATASNIIYDSADDPSVTEMFGENAEISGTWSPEIHYFSEEDCPGCSGWYMLFALRNSNTKIYPVVLKASGTLRPTGPWRNPVTGVANATQRFLDAQGNAFDQWAIGVSYLRIPTGRYKGLYALWVDETGRGQGYGNFYQRIRIARLSKPWQIASEAGIVTTPTQAWEQDGADETYPMVVEGGTAVYGEHGEIFITYCGSGYWSHYGQGQLTLKRENGDYADPLQTESWIKYEGNPVFSSEESSDLRGAGHVFFFNDDAGNGFFCYHAYPYVNGERQSSRNAYVEPYYIDYDAVSETSPQGVIRFGAVGDGVTAPVTGTKFSFYKRN